MRNKLIRRRQTGFTLIELLTVIAIIAVLVGLLFPAIQTALRKADSAKALTEVNSLTSAWKAYFTEYGRWPTDTTGKLLGQDITVGSSDGYQMLEDVVALLQGSKTAVGNYVPATHNPRAIQFIEISSKSVNATRAFVDPWGSPYRCLLDHDYDNQVKNPNVSSPASLSYSVICWSRGPDGKDNTVAAQKDDPRSW